MLAAGCPGLIDPAGTATGSGMASPPMSPAGLRLVVGGDGVIGAELTRQLVSSGNPVVATTRRPRKADGPALFLDLAADPAGWELPDRVGVGYLCGAITSVDQCRQFPDETRLVNVGRTLHLAHLLRRRGAHVVFLSSNQVFDGSRPLPPVTAPRAPQTEYGRHKAQAEVDLLAAGGATVVRFTKVVGPGWALFQTWTESLRRGEPIAPFHDMYLSPVPLSFAAGVLVRVGESRPGGVVQVSGDRDVSYAEVAARLAERIGALPSLVRPVSFASKDLPLEMALPNTAMSSARLAAELGLTPPPVWDTIDVLIKGLFHA
ncbi:MAG: dTDP-4-dehydrorhamnose reductase [Gemmataceae bacterium]|nr:dTDP-4-dehydrorhamnose reductase [Gemmataceae bacterium]